MSEQSRAVHTGMYACLLGALGALDAGLGFFGHSLRGHVITSFFEPFVN